MCINGYNSRIPYLCGLSAFWYCSTMRKINHSRIVADNCLIVPVNSNNSRCSCYRIRIVWTVLFCAVHGPADLYFFLCQGLAHRAATVQPGADRSPGTPRYPGPVIQVPYVRQKIILYFQIWSVNDFTGNTTKSN